MKYASTMLLMILALALSGWPTVNLGGGVGDEYVCFWPNAELCIDLEEPSVSSDCEASPTLARLPGGFTTMDCLSNSGTANAPLTGNWSIFGDGEDTTDGEVGWNDGESGVRAGNTTCVSDTDDACQWRFRLEFVCSSNGAVFDFFKTEASAGTDVFAAYLDCRGGSATADIGLAFAGDSVTNAGSFLSEDTVYNICITLDYLSASPDATLFVDTGTTWCSGDTTSAVVTDGTDPAVTIDQFKFGDNAADRNIGFNIDDIGFHFDSGF
jgi:hypothetical protein